LVGFEVGGLDDGVDGKCAACFALAVGAMAAVCDEGASKEAVGDCFAGTAATEGDVGRLCCHAGNGNRFKEVIS